MNGGETYRSTFGAIVTIVVYMVTLIYASNKALKLQGRLDTHHQSSFEQKPIDELRPLTFVEADFSFMITLLPNDLSASIE